MVEKEILARHCGIVYQDTRDWDEVVYYLVDMGADLDWAEKFVGKNKDLIRLLRYPKR